MTTAASEALLAAVCVLLAMGCTQRAPAEQQRGALQSAATEPAAELHFAGDVYFGEAYRSELSSAPSAERYEVPLSGLRAALSTAPVVANLEAALTRSTDSAVAQDKTYLHASQPERTAAALSRHGFVGLSLANNHAMDYGLDALERTCAFLRRGGLTPFGAGKTQSQASEPFHLERPLAGRTVSVAVIGAYWYRQTYDEAYAFYADERHGGVRRLASEEIAAQIRRLKEAAPQRSVVVFPHWGSNYQWRDDEQRRLAHALVDAGADLIAGHGAHAYQEIERYRGRWILYGLGNLVFLSPGRYAEHRRAPYSMLATLRWTLQQGRLARELRLRFIASDNMQTGYQPHLLAADAFRAALDVLKDHSCQNESAFCVEASMASDSIGPYVQLPVSP